jgi:hypothetical protein
MHTQVHALYAYQVQLFSIYLQYQNTSTKDISSKLLRLLAGLLLRLLSDLLLLPFSVDISSKYLVILPSLMKFFLGYRQFLF